VGMPQQVRHDSRKNAAMKYRNFVKKILKLTFVLIIALSILSAPAFEFFQPFRLFTWAALVFFFAITLVSGYYNSRSIKKPFFFNIYMGTLALKFFLSLMFIVVFLFGFKPESKMFVVPFFLLFIIYKAFETWMLLKFAQEPEEKN